MISGRPGSVPSRGDLGMGVWRTLNERIFLWLPFRAIVCVGSEARSFLNRRL